MIEIELDKIQKHLKKNGLEATLQSETDQLCLLLSIGETQFPLFIRIFDGGELLQLLTFLPCNVKEETIDETARLLHMVNKEIDLPGFGMDEGAHLIYYRCMLPVKDKKIPASIFDAYINASEVVCKAFAPVVAAVAHGAASLAEVLEKAKESQTLQAKK